MSLFKRKKPEEKLSFKLEMAEKMIRNRLRYATERDGDTDSVIGKNGGFNSLLPANILFIGDCASKFA